MRASLCSAGHLNNKVTAVVRRDPALGASGVQCTWLRWFQSGPLVLAASLLMCRAAADGCVADSAVVDVVVHSWEYS